MENGVERIGGYEMKELGGACLIPVTERNFKEKPCHECGKWFKPLYPYMKYCCKSCAKVGQRRKQKEYSAKLKSEAKRHCGTSGIVDIRYMTWNS